MTKKATPQIGLPGRLMRLRPSLQNDAVMALMCDAGSPKPSPKNPFFPPRAAWFAVLRGLRVRHEYPGFTEDVAAMVGGETTAHTYGEIAQAFEVSLSTVKAWAATGMPGIGEGRLYDMIEILAWRLSEDEAASRPSFANLH